MKRIQSKSENPAPGSNQHNSAAIDSSESHDVGICSNWCYMIIVTVAGLAGLISSILGMVDAWAGTATQKAHEIEDSIESWKDTNGGSDIFSDTFSFKVQSLDYADDFYATS